MFKRILLFVVLPLIIVAIFWGSKGYWGKFLPAHASGQRQAVFMANGQVYFGNISNADKQIVKLSNVYYLKTDDLQSNDPNKKITLVKMGNELHGPENAMYINRDQIIFYQDLTNSSKVNDAISRFSSQAVPQPAPTAAN